MSPVGTYRSRSGELVHVRIDASGQERCDVECLDGTRREGCEVCDCDVLLSEDPDWPWADARGVPSLVTVD